MVLKHQWQSEKWAWIIQTIYPVSYTHLDVYKRQHEPQCSVKIALDEGRIPKGRYDNYRQFFDEISNKRKY